MNHSPEISRQASMEVRQRFAVGKARVFSMLFHTIRHPGMHRTEFVSAHDAPYADLSFVRAGVARRTAEAWILDPDLSTRQKAGYIMEQFAHVAESLVGQDDPDVRYRDLLTICDEAIGDSERFLTPDGRQLLTSHILPPQDVIDDMFDTYIAAGRTCPNLETFIDGQSTSGNRI